jgi:hypothetical protein
VKTEINYNIEYNRMLRYNINVQQVYARDRWVENLSFIQTGTKNESLFCLANV